MFQYLARQGDAKGAPLSPATVAILEKYNPERLNDSDVSIEVIQKRVHSKGYHDTRKELIKNGQNKDTANVLASQAGWRLVAAWKLFFGVEAAD